MKQSPLNRSQDDEIKKFLILLADLSINQIPDILGKMNSFAKTRKDVEQKENKLSDPLFALSKQDIDQLTNKAPTRDIPRTASFTKMAKNISLSEKLKKVAKEHPIYSTIVAGFVEGISHEIQDDMPGLQELKYGIPPFLKLIEKIAGIDKKALPPDLYNGLKEMYTIRAEALSKFGKTGRYKEDKDLKSLAYGLMFKHRPYVAQISEFVEAISKKREHNLMPISEILDQAIQNTDINLPQKVYEDVAEMYKIRMEALEEFNKELMQTSHKNIASTHYLMALNLITRKLRNEKFQDSAVLDAVDEINNAIAVSLAYMGTGLFDMGSFMGERVGSVLSETAKDNIRTAFEIQYYALLADRGMVQAARYLDAIKESLKFVADLKNGKIVNLDQVKALVGLDSTQQKSKRNKPHKHKDTTKLKTDKKTSTLYQLVSKGYVKPKTKSKLMRDELNADVKIMDKILPKQLTHIRNQVIEERKDDTKDYLFTFLDKVKKLVYGKSGSKKPNALSGAVAAVSSSVAKIAFKPEKVIEDKPHIKNLKHYESIETKYGSRLKRRSTGKSSDNSSRRY